MDWRRLFGISKLSKPEFIRDYERLLERKIPNRKPLNELEFLVFDTETTGLNVKKDFVLSYGSVQVSNYRIKINTAKEFYLKPKRLNREAIKIHGLVKERPYIRRHEMVREFVKDAADRILVGQHLGFDLAMMERLGKIEGLTRIKKPCT
jgi:DNA polymerase III subunit epsilon